MQDLEMKLISERAKSADLLRALQLIALEYGNSKPSKTRMGELAESYLRKYANRIPS